MTRDIAFCKDAHGLREDERRIVKRSLGFFVTADSLAANNIVLGTLCPNEENLFPWMSEMTDLKNERNFFETRVFEYQSGAALSWA